MEARLADSNAAAAAGYTLLAPDPFTFSGLWLSRPRRLWRELEPGCRNTGGPAGQMAASSRRSGACPATDDTQRAIRLHAWTQGRVSRGAETGIARGAIRRVRRNRDRIVSVGHGNRRGNLRGRWFFTPLYPRTATRPF